MLQVPPIFEKKTTDFISIDSKGRVHTFCCAVPGCWHVMGVTQSAGLSLKWFRDNLCWGELETAVNMGVDPYYLIQKAQVYGVLPRIMSAARHLNDGMGEYVANQTIKLMNKKGVLVKDAKILILGITFKENCPDIRNTKVVDIYHTLNEFTDNIIIYDPWADADLVRKEYDIEITNILPENGAFDAAILAVSHNEFSKLNLKSLMKENSVIYDVKGFLDRDIVDGRL